MANDQGRIPYDEHDNAVIANNVYHQLCEMDQEDRANNREPRWQDINTLAETLRAYDNRIDVAYLAEERLLDELGYIERDRHNNNVRLTEPGRQNCERGINIPPSSHQIR